MVRLRTVSSEDPGWTRRRCGRGFVHLDEDGARLPADDSDRVRGLAIPPAWEDVWICPVPNGHLQAVGTDEAGRRQYLYHPDWRRQRDLAKFDCVLELGGRLPRIRDRLAEDLAREGMPLERGSAVAVRMLDLGYFRIGSDAYADEYGSFGLTTLERRHVRSVDGVLRFRFTGKSGGEHEVDIDDAAVLRALTPMRRRRSDEPVLLAYKQGGRWRRLEPAEVNDYLRDVARLDVTAKDFRTWHATVLAAVALAEEPDGDSKAARKRVEVAAMREVGEYLGNTPAVARSSYVDPRLVEHFRHGRTITVPEGASSGEDRDGAQRRLERRVLRLLR